MVYNLWLAAFTLGLFSSQHRVKAIPLLKCRVDVVWMWVQWGIDGVEVGSIRVDEKSCDNWMVYVCPFVVIFNNPTSSNCPYLVVIKIQGYKRDSVAFIGWVRHYQHPHASTATVKYYEWKVRRIIGCLDELWTQIIFSPLFITIPSKCFFANLPRRCWDRGG